MCFVRPRNLSKYFKIKEYSWDTEDLEIVTGNDYLNFTIGITYLGINIDHKSNIYSYILTCIIGPLANWMVCYCFEVS